LNGVEKNYFFGHLLYIGIVFVLSSAGVWRVFVLGRRRGNFPRGANSEPIPSLVHLFELCLLVAVWIGYWAELLRIVD
jgi:hypothetical protein